MSSATVIPDSPAEGPREEAPEFGVVTMHGVPVSEVAYWRDGDLHVFRSTEFDVIAADSDLNAAAAKLVESAEDYADMLLEVPRDEITSDELVAAMLILRRTTKAYRKRAQELQRELAWRRRVIRALRGRSREPQGPWYRKSSLPISSPRQRA